MLRSPINSFNLTTTNAIHPTISNGLPDQNYKWITHNIISWNMCGFYAKREELQLLINKYSPYVICLQELKIKTNQIIKVKGYTLISKVREDGCGGAALLIKDGFHFEELPDNSTLDIISAKIYMDRVFTISSIYFHYTDNISLTQLKDIYKNIDTNLIIIGDFNAHNQLWNSTRTDKRGKVIEKFLQTKNMNILNQGEITRVSSVFGQNHAVLDLALCNTTFSNNLNFSVADETHSSDHYPIFLDFPDKPEQQKIMPKFIIKKADWVQYRSDVDLTKVDLTESNEIVLNNITNLIKDAAIKNIPMSGNKSSKKMVPWWSDEVNNCINQKRNFSEYIGIIILLII